MTTSQIWKYRAEWGKAWKALRLAGVEASERERTRKRWHLLIGAVVRRGPHAGEPKSSTVLTNAEFDAFLKRCAATESPADLERQLALDAQPELRALTACGPLLDTIAMPAESRANYIAGIYRNMQRARIRGGARELALAEMPDADLQLVLIALTHTVEHKLGTAHNHPSSEYPRSQSAHRVGHRRQSVPADDPPRVEPFPSYVPPADDSEEPLF